MARVLQQIARQHLGPRRFLQCRLLGYAPEIVVRKDTHARKIQLPRQTPNDLGGNVAQTALGCFVREDGAKEDCSLTAPVLANFVPDAHHVRR